MFETMTRSDGAALALFMTWGEVPETLATLIQRALKLPLEGRAVTAYLAPNVLHRRPWHQGAHEFTFGSEDVRTEEQGSEDLDGGRETHVTSRAIAGRLTRRYRDQKFALELYIPMVGDQAIREFSDAGRRRNEGVISEDAYRQQLALIFEMAIEEALANSDMSNAPTAGGKRAKKRALLTQARVAIAAGDEEAIVRIGQQAIESVQLTKGGWTFLALVREFDRTGYRPTIRRNLGDDWRALAECYDAYQTMHNSPARTYPDTKPVVKPPKA